MKTQISVNKALGELKLYDAKIKRKINGANLVAVEQEGRIPNSSTTVEEFKNEAKGAYQSILALIKNRNTIKAAVVQSNAETNVVIGGVTMSVADAIERKTSIEYDELLLRDLRKQRSDRLQSVEYINSRLDADADRHIETFLSGAQKDTRDSVDLEAMRAPYQKRKASVLEGVLDLDKIITELEDSIESFLSEVDNALTESNVVTKIEIDLADS